MKKIMKGGQGIDRSLMTGFILLFLFLYVFFFYSLYNNIPGQSYAVPVGQYYSYIVIFMLNIAFGVGITRLFTSETFESFQSKLFSEGGGSFQWSTIFDEDNSFMLRVFVFIFIIGYLTQFITLIIVMVVFGYGFGKQKQSSSGNKNEYKMTHDNAARLKVYNNTLLALTIILFVMFFLFVYNYAGMSSNLDQNRIRNIILMICAIAGFVCILVEYFTSIGFFIHVKLKKRMLFTGVVPG